MELRTRWLVLVMVGLGLAIMSVDGGQLPQAGLMSAQASGLPAVTHAVAPRVFDPASLNTPMIAAADYFWLGAILAMVLALVAVYMRWAVLERSDR
ncbi:MAG: hypothetical protein H0T53_01090 [Herpetosiphonaceae bacterium]|nr:hypothetical protein [Herpetosiphonaceae bacterium]